MEGILFCCLFDDAEIRAWEVLGGAPMRICFCDICNLHGRRRAEYILCSIIQGRYNTYNVQDIKKQFEEEGLDRFISEGELGAYISEVCRNQIVLFTRLASRCAEEGVDPKVPIAYEI